MKPFLPVFLLLLVFTACEPGGAGRITSRADYDRYLDTAADTAASKHFTLWHAKIRPDSLQLTSFGIVAGEYARNFEASGRIGYLKQAEQALERAVAIAAIGKADYYRALARNYISQHRFREARALADSARVAGGADRADNALQFDVLMELGQYDAAKRHLDALRHPNRMDYMIRLAKWSDHRGNLPKAIEVLEHASRLADASGNPALRKWCYTNLADYYGHSGALEDSYRYYLRALALDPADAYAKKGIAWIVYSHERRPEEALRILKSVVAYHQTPDLLLLLADIAGDLGDPRGRSEYLDRFDKLVRHPDYGYMYAAHRIALFLENGHNARQALKWAREEVDRRDTPETRALLAYALYRSERLTEALELIRDSVDGRTFEPEPLLYAAEIYKAYGMDGNAARLAGELEDAVFELGPGTEARLDRLKIVKGSL